MYPEGRLLSSGCLFFSFRTSFQKLCFDSWLALLSFVSSMTHLLSCQSIDRQREQAGGRAFGTGRLSPRDIPTVPRRRTELLPTPRRSQPARASAEVHFSTHATITQNAQTQCEHLSQTNHRTLRCQGVVQRKCDAAPRLHLPTTRPAMVDL